MASMLVTPLVNAQSVKYELIARFQGESPASLRNFVASSDGRFVAVPLKAKNMLGEYVSVNGVAGKIYDKILARSLIWSPDGQTLAYVGERGTEHFLVQNNQETKLGGNFQQMGFSSNPSFSADSKSVLWVSRVDGGMTVYVDGKPEPMAERVSYAAFRGQKNENIFISHQKCKSHIVDSVFGDHPYYDTISFPIFSQSGLVYLYEASSDSTNYLVREDKSVVASTTEGAFIYFTLSPDASRTLYMEPLSSATGYRTRVHITDLATAEFEGQNSGAMAKFSPDNKRVLYAITDNEQTLVVIDTIKLGSWASVLPESLAWSPDSNRYAYIATDSTGGVFVVTEKGKSAKLSNVLPSSLVFSSDSKGFAYIASDIANGLASNFYVVVDGKAFKSRYDEIRHLFFLPSGKVVFHASKRNKNWVVIGENAFLIDADAIYDKTFVVQSDGALEFLVRKGVDFRIARISGDK